MAGPYDHLETIPCELGVLDLQYHNPGTATVTRKYVLGILPYFAEVCAVSSSYDYCEDTEVLCYRP